MDNEKMYVKESLCHTLMDILTALCIEANGGMVNDELTEEQIEKAEEYSRTKFCEIMDEWEKATGKAWAVMVEEEEEEEEEEPRERFIGLAEQVDD